MPNQARLKTRGLDGPLPLEYVGAMAKALQMIGRAAAWYYRAVTHRRKPGCCTVCDDPLGPNDPDYCIECREIHEW